MADSRIYKLEDGMDVETIGIGLENFLKQKKNLHAEGLRTAEGYLVQAKQEDKWKKYVGMDSAIQVQLYKTETMVTVNIGSGKWVDKAGAATAGMILFAPLAVTAAIGAWSQKKLPEEIFDFIEQFILTGGRNISVSMSSSRGLNGDQVICPNCKAVNQKGTKFCMSCGSSLANECPSCHASVPFGVKFCPQCGSNVGSTEKSTNPECPDCHKEVNEGTKFCPHCGSKIEHEVKACGNCGEALEANQKFCPKCGTSTEK